MWWHYGSRMMICCCQSFSNEELQRNPAGNIKVKISEKETALAKSIIKSMEGKFNPEDYIDEYNQRVKQAIKDKASGKTIKEIDKSKPIKITDLMEALQESVKNIDKNKVIKMKKKAQ